MVESGSVNETKPLVFSDGVTKEDIRQKMWEYIEKHDLADVPRPVYNRIPNFKDRNAAAEHLSTFEFFQKAHTVKINPDKPQEWARFLSLEAKKDLLVPTPRLRGGLFNRIIPTSTDKETLKICATTQGIRKFSKAVGLDAKVQVDMIVSGSVAVSKRGYRIGKGEGFADLEYAMMRAMGAAKEDTIIVTTCHDCQVVDIPESLMEDHDFMVDYILTPTQVIKCERNKPQPSGIIWSKLSPRRLKQVPILKDLREREKENGKDVELRKPSSDSEEEEERMRNERRQNGRKQGRNRRRYRRSRDQDENDPDREKSGLSVKYDFAREKREVSVRDGEEGSDGEARPLRPSNRQQGRRKYRKTRVRGARKNRDSQGSDGEGSPRRYSDQENSDEERRGGGRYQRRYRRSSSDDRYDRRQRDGYRNRGYGRRYRGSFRRGDSFKPTVYVGNFPYSLRVSTFKAAVREKGVQPLAVLWKYSYAFLLMPDIETAKSAVETLTDIEFEGQVAKVELSRLCQEREGIQQNGDGGHDDTKRRSGGEQDVEDYKNGKIKKEGKPHHDVKQEPHYDVKQEVTSS